MNTKNSLKGQLESLLPAGIDMQQELRWIAFLLAASLLYSMGYLISLANAYQSLFTLVANKKVLMDGAVMPDFADLLESGLTGFLITALSMVGFIGYHYIYHFQGSKSIYLMKRLPYRWELWKRCISLPVLAAVSSLTLAAVLLVVYYGIYLLVTPDGCLVPNQWEQVWDVYFNVKIFH